MEMNFVGEAVQPVLICAAFRNFYLFFLPFSLPSCSSRAAPSAPETPAAQGSTTPWREGRLSWRTSWCPAPARWTNWLVFTRLDPCPCYRSLMAQFSLFIWTVYDAVAIDHHGQLNPLFAVHLTFIQSTMGWLDENEFLDGWMSQTTGRCGWLSREKEFFWLSRLSPASRCDFWVMC